MTEFSDLLRDRASAIWELEHQHPFVVELGNGTLPLEKFQWYMKQDYLFLIDFSRVIAMAVAKADTLEDMGWFARLLHETLNTEMALHVSFCEGLRDTRGRPPGNPPVAHDPRLRGPHALQRPRRHDRRNRGDAPAMLVGLRRDRAGAGGSRQARRPPPLLSLDRNVQLARVRRAGRVAPLVHRPHSDRTCSDRQRERLADIFVANSKYEYLFWDAAYRMESMARLGVRVGTRSRIRRATGMRPPRNRKAPRANPGLW